MRLFFVGFSYLCFFISPLGSSPAYAYTLNDLRGESQACQNVLYQKDRPFEGCLSPQAQTTQELSKSFRAIDQGLALSEIKKNIRLMAELQVTKSLSLLQQVGVTSKSPALEHQLLSLKKQGYNIHPTQNAEEPELGEKYLLASLRYQELRKLSGNSSYLNESDRKDLKERIALLETRYPLVANHGFSKLSLNASAMLRASYFVPKETPDEALLLDNFLFNKTPEKVSELKTQDLKTTSTIGRLTKAYSLNTNPRIKTELRKVLREELQDSLARQLAALKKLDSFSECELMTLHSEVSLLAINSSTQPQEVFANFCECQAANPPIPENALLVTGLVAGAAGLLCIAPTGIGQLIACPTAVAAGWTTASGSAINFTHQLSRYGSYQDQGSVLRVLEGGLEDRPELDLLSKKESELSREMVNENMLGMIGFGVGHIGFSGLAKLYSKSKLSGSLRKLSGKDRQELEDALSSLSKEDQSRAFVVLDKLDEESRALLIKKPELLNKELKGVRCEM